MAPVRPELEAETLDDDPEAEHVRVD